MHFIILYLMTIINIYVIIYIKYIFLFCGILSIFIGTLGALNQVKIKRLFAFSSIAI